VEHPVDFFEKCTRKIKRSDRTKKMTGNSKLETTQLFTGEPLAANERRKRRQEKTRINEEELDKTCLLEKCEEKEDCWLRESTDLRRTGRASFPQSRELQRGSTPRSR